MNAAVLLLTVATMCQCPPVYYDAPVYCYSLIYEKVYFSESVQTRRIVEAVLWPSGKRITVPILNGYMPTISVNNNVDGSTLREYYYDNRDVYNGGIIEYGHFPKKYFVRPPTESRESAPTLREPVPKKIMPRFTDDDFESMQKNIKILEDTVRVLQQKEKASQLEIYRPPLSLQVEPNKIPMKKPSQFGQE